MNKRILAITCLVTLAGTNMNALTESRKEAIAEAKRASERAREERIALEAADRAFAERIEAEDRAFAEEPAAPDYRAVEAGEEEPESALAYSAISIDEGADLVNEEPEEAPVYRTVDIGEEDPATGIFAHVKNGVVYLWDNHKGKVIAVGVVAGTAVGTTAVWYFTGHNPLEQMATVKDRAMALSPSEIIEGLKSRASGLKVGERMDALKGRVMGLFPSKASKVSPNTLAGADLSAIANPEIVRNCPTQGEMDGFFKAVAVVAKPEKVVELGQALSGAELSVVANPEALVVVAPHKEAFITGALGGAAGYITNALGVAKKQVAAITSRSARLAAARATRSAMSTAAKENPRAAAAYATLLAAQKAVRVAKDAL